jgi:hypothetical protein
MENQASMNTSLMERIPVELLEYQPHRQFKETLQ